MAKKKKWSKSRWEKQQREALSSQFRGQYTFLSKPTRESPNYTVKGPGRENIQAVSPKVFTPKGGSLSSSISHAQRENLIDPGAVKAVEQATGLTAHPGIIRKGTAGVPQQKKQAPPAPVPYSLLPGFKKARVRRMTLLRGLTQGITGMARRLNRFPRMSG